MQTWSYQNVVSPGSWLQISKPSRPTPTANHSRQRRKSKASSHKGNTAGHMRRITFFAANFIPASVYLARSCFGRRKMYSIASCNAFAPDLASEVGPDRCN